MRSSISQRRRSPSPRWRSRRRRAHADVKIGVAGPITGANASFGAQLTQRRRPGRRGLQQVRRHSRPEDRRRAGRRRLRSQTGRLGRQQVRRRRRQVRRRPLQFRRDDPGVRSLRRQRRAVHHAVGDQSEGHRPRACGTRSAPAAATTSRASSGPIWRSASSRTRRSPSCTTRRLTARASPTRRAAS